METITGARISSVLADLARLRIAVFRQWPYLYDGDEAYERSYLEVYTRSAAAAVIVARDAGRVVGASSCLPLADEAAAMGAPFVSRALDLGRFFYFAESVLQPAYRGQGIGVRFFEARERIARGTAAEFAVFCAVRRPADHPLRPVGAASLRAFWNNRGFTELPGISCKFAWKEIQSEANVLHDLDYWIKPLRGAAIPPALLKASAA